MLDGRLYYVFLLFALVGLLEMAFVIYRIVRRADCRETLKRLDDHLEEGREADEVTDAFYEEHRRILEDDSSNSF